MEPFVVDQRWIMSDPVFGIFFGTVIEASAGGASGTVIITGDKDDIVDTFDGSAAAFQDSGEWRLVEESDTHLGLTFSVQGHIARSHLKPPNDNNAVTNMLASAFALKGDTERTATELVEEAAANP